MTRSIAATRWRWRGVAAAVLFSMAHLAPPAQAQTAPAEPTRTATPEKFTFVTNWFAQAEHGGFYQALASGLYREAGLDVTIRMGGPQVNSLQLLAAGQADCIMGFDVQTLSAWEQGIEAVTVAAAFQKDAIVMVGHPGVVKRLEDLKGKTLLLATPAYSTFWPWLKSTYKLDDAITRPYTFNNQAFLADRNAVQQGYLTSEPYSIEKEGGFKPAVFLLADHGWPPYSTTIVCMAKTVRERERAVAAFVRASMKGWKGYLQGAPVAIAAANALIKKDNPSMSDDRIAHAIGLLKSTGMVMGGEAARLGIGVITDERMKATYDMLVAQKLLDPKKVPLSKTYTTHFVREMKVMP
ncbi:MAG: ABC transporter substrate-binding protein [Rubrivivax sp.]|nr:ABC transporter substrate-binding protein [Rubrivivax sp.]